MNEHSNWQFSNRSSVADNVLAFRLYLVLSWNPVDLAWHDAELLEPFLGDGSAFLMVRVVATLFTVSALCNVVETAAAVLLVREFHVETLTVIFEAAASGVREAELILVVGCWDNQVGEFFCRL